MNATQRDRSRHRVGVRALNADGCLIAIDGPWTPLAHAADIGFAVGATLSAGTPRPGRQYRRTRSQSRYPLNTDHVPTAWFYDAAPICDWNTVPSSAPSYSQAPPGTRIAKRSSSCAHVPRPWSATSPLKASSLMPSPATPRRQPRWAAGRPTARRSTPDAGSPPPRESVRWRDWPPRTARPGEG